MFNFFIDSAQAVSLPTIGGGQDLPAFISSVYSFALTVVGIAVFVQIVRAGFAWLTAAGNVGKASGAKTMMTNAVIGAILLFAAYMILFTINPDLVRNTFNFSIPGSETVQQGESSLNTNSTTGTAAVYGFPGTGTGSRLIQSVNAQAGIYFFTIRVVDAAGDRAERNYSMEVHPRIVGTSNKEPLGSQFYANPKIVRAQEHGDLEITTPFVPDAVIGVPYFAEIQAIGGVPPYVFSVSGGSLPPGLSLAATADIPLSVIAGLIDGHIPTGSGTGSGTGGGTGGGTSGGGTGGGTDGGTSGECTGFGTGTGETDFTAEWATCRDADRTGDLPACGTCGLPPGTPCEATGRTADGRPTVTIRCTYSDQAQAIRCGAPGSGEYCLPGYTNPGCLDSGGGLQDAPVCSPTPTTTPTPSGTATPTPTGGSGSCPQGYTLCMSQTAGQCCSPGLECVNGNCVSP